jgi:hypothetical protein
MNNCRWMCLLTLAIVGCSSRPATVALRGEVTCDGQPVENGQIDFVPIENTPGASAVATIANGRYEIVAKGGLRPDGTYSVRIVAYRKTGVMEPNRFDRAGPPIERQVNYIPAAYNSESTLMLRVAEVPDENKVDFQLGTAPISAGR